MAVQGTAPVTALGARSAAELLAQAAHDTDLWRSEAQNRADELLRAARDEAQLLAATARREPDKLVTRARAEVARPQRLDDDSRDRLRRHAEILLSEAHGPLAQS